MGDIVKQKWSNVFGKKKEEKEKEQSNFFSEMKLALKSQVPKARLLSTKHRISVNAQILIM